MSLSKDDLPGNFSVDKIPAFDVSGLKLSQAYVDTNKLLRFSRVKVINQTISYVSGSQIYLDINPSNLGISMSKAINASNYTRAGFIPQYWGDELDIINAQGKSAAFLHKNDGLTRQKANETVAYKNFMNLLLLYKNNSVNFRNSSLLKEERTEKYNSISQIKKSYKKQENTGSNQSLLASSTRKTIDTRNLVELKYLDLLCYGNFESFAYSQSPENPFNFDYTFEFVVLFYNSPPLVEGHIDNA